MDIRTFGVLRRFGAARAGFYCFLFLFFGRYTVSYISDFDLARMGSEMPQWLHLLVQRRPLPPSHGAQIPKWSCGK